ncbi:reverse transcriptase domain-containing protein [Tanacetum coccineum]
MKLNLKKCVFGVETCQFLGHIITKQGIEANPEKVKAVIDMISPRTIWEVQSLDGKLAALGHFLAKSAEKALSLAKWAIELGEHDIIYKPSDGSRAGIILTDPNGKEITYALRFDFPTSNNEAEYEALIAGLKLALRLEESFESFSITQVSRLKNKRADALSKLASSSFAHLTKNVLVEVIPYKSIEVHATNTVEDAGKTWMTPIIEYLQDGRLPEDPNLTSKIRIMAPQYSMKQDILYKKGYSAPWLRCVGPNQAHYVLQEAHFGSFGAYAGARKITQKAIRLRYYWPTMYRDANQVVDECHNC